MAPPVDNIGMSTTSKDVVLEASERKTQDIIDTYLFLLAQLFNVYKAVSSYSLYRNSQSSCWWSCLLM